MTNAPVCPRVLLVDDDKNVLRGLGLLLSGRGLEIVTAPNADEALGIMEEESGMPEVLVTDVMMPPGMDGVELAHEARLLGFLGPIVLVTGAQVDGLQKRSESAFVHRILQKPAGKELVDTIEELLEKKPSEWDSGQAIDDA